MEKRSILVVEDNWLIATELASLFAQSGFHILGPVSNVSAALEILRVHRPHMAVLDVRLGDDRSYPIARVLADRGVQFCFVTAYATTDLPEEFSGRPILRKPIGHMDLAAGIRRLVH